MEITLVSQPYDEVSYEIINMMTNEEGIKEIFKNSFSRFASSILSFLIKSNNETIGFMYLTPENINNFLLIDMGIKKQYRNKGYGNAAIKRLKEILQYTKLYHSSYIISEVKDNNILCNNMLKNQNSKLVYSVEKDNQIYNYYLLQEELENQLLNGDIDKLIDHINNFPDKKKVLSR